MTYGGMSDTRLRWAVRAATAAAVFRILCLIALWIVCLPLTAAAVASGEPGPVLWFGDQVEDMRERVARIETMKNELALRRLL